MKLVTYKSGESPDETVFYTAAAVRLVRDQPTAVEDGDVPEMKGHKFDVKDLKGDAAKDVKVGDVVRLPEEPEEKPKPGAGA